MSPRLLRLIFNLYPPYLGTGITVRHIAPDYRRIEVDMALRWYNRNYVGTHFGGSLSAMTDPFYMLMVMHNLGPDYLVWDRFGTIDYLKPGRGRVFATFRIEPSQVETFRAATANGEPHLPTLSVDIVDPDGQAIARVTRQLWIRRKRRV